MDDPGDVEAKFAFDQALANLAAQRTDLQELQGRAKDLIGLLTLAATFLGAFGKNSVEGLFSALSSQPRCELYTFLAFPAVTLVACLYVMVPRSFWLFGVNAESVAASIRSRESGEGFTGPAQLYLWYVDELAPFSKRNTTKIRWRKWAIWLATAGLAGSVAFTGYLVVGKI
jgi:hypothetical protein